MYETCSYNHSAVLLSIFSFFFKYDSDSAFYSVSSYIVASCVTVNSRDHSVFVDLNFFSGTEFSRRHLPDILKILPKGKIKLKTCYAAFLSAPS